MAALRNCSVRVLRTDPVTGNVEVEIESGPTPTAIIQRGGPVGPQNGPREHAPSPGNWISKNGKAWSLAQPSRSYRDADGRLRPALRSEIGILPDRYSRAEVTRFITLPETTLKRLMRSCGIVTTRRWYLWEPDAEEVKGLTLEQVQSLLRASYAFIEKQYSKNPEYLDPSWRRGAQNHSPQSTSEDSLCSDESDAQDAHSSSTQETHHAHTSGTENDAPEPQWPAPWTPDGIVDSSQDTTT
jgi:hypothetical protein